MSQDQTERAERVDFARASATATTIKAIASRGKQAARELDPTVELRDMQLPRELRELLNAVLDGTAATLDPLELPDPYGGPVQHWCTVLRTPGNDQRVLLHMPLRILNAGANIGAVAAQQYVLTKSIPRVYVFSAELDMPHYYYRALGNVGSRRLPQSRVGPVA
jgi:hypothetical protein